MRFVALSLVAGVVFAALMTGFVMSVDPYGVASRTYESSKFADIKPARWQIDRLVKPLDVVIKRPKTLLMGSSRMVRAFDPQVFEGTRFAPAYNASIPGTNVAEHFRFLEFYIENNPDLQTVIFEGFFSQFAASSFDPPITYREFITDRVPLFVGSDAVLDAFRTLQFNREESLRRPNFISQNGVWDPLERTLMEPNLEPGSYIEGVQGWDARHGTKTLHPADKIFRRFIEVARAHDVEVLIVMLPDYPWEDYRNYSNGQWPLFAEWHRELAQYGNVFSFAHYDDVSTGSEGAWYDPLHPSISAGRNMIEALLDQLDGRPNPNVTSVRPDNVDTLMSRRRAAVEEWALENPRFAEQYEENKRSKFPSLVARTPDTPFFRRFTPAPGGR